MAKLILSKPEVKEYYATLATALLSYEKVRSHLNWSGISFVIGRNTLVKFTFGGKTLVSFFALEPADYSQGKYKLTDVSEVKRYAKTRGKLRITSSRSVRFALRLIADLAEQNGLTVKKTPIEPIAPKDFPTDSFQNLLTRGLIRVLKVDASKYRTGSIPAVVQEVAGIKDGAEVAAAVAVPTKIAELKDLEAYEDTVSTTDELMLRHKQYAELLENIRNAEPKIRFRKKSVLSAVDEAWITEIEDCAQALDEVTRNPMHYIEETEELLSIERTKKVTQRSIQHLSQHSGLISRIEGDTIIPSKLLNVFRDDSIMTYENKFVNTLLKRMYDFVSMRYDWAKEGADKDLTSMDFDEVSYFGETHGKISIHVELNTPKEDKGKNYAKHTDLWRRLERVYEMVSDYQKSEFARNMGTVYIRPPVMRTNALLRNKNFRRLLELWEYLDGYDDTEGVVFEEKDLHMDATYKNYIFNAVAEQYLALRHNVGVNDVILAEQQQIPEVVNEVINVAATAPAEPKDVPIDDDTLMAMEVALAVDDVLDDMNREERERIHAARQEALMQSAPIEPKPEDRPKSVVDDQPVEIPKTEPMEWETDEVAATDETKDDTDDVEKTEVVTKGEDGILYREITTYRKTMQAKLLLAGDQLKEYYVGIYNRLVSFKGMRVRQAADYVTFSAGKPLVRMTIIGKTLRVYYALEPGSLPTKYNVTDASDVKKYAATPALLFVRGSRTYAYALELCDMICQGMKEAADPLFTRVEDYPPTDLETLIERGMVKRVVTRVPLGGSLFGAGATVVTDETSSTAQERTDAPAAQPMPVTVPLILQETTPDPDFGKDYEEAAEELIATEKTPPARTISLEEPGMSEKIRDVLKQTEEEMEKERAEKAAAEQQRMPDGATGGDGDPLMLRKDALITLRTEKEEPQQKEAPEEPEQVVVPMGGDTLEPKPITAEEIDKYLSGKGISVPATEEAGAATEETPEETEQHIPVASKKRRFFFWQRKKK